MQTMGTMNDRLRGLDYADMALPAGLPPLSLLGWMLATSVRHDQEHSHIYFGAAFISFAASYVTAYSYRNVLERMEWDEPGRLKGE
jgi:formate hydrogenlyase subunit 3/multisubunit Na+/H+ antiporter MnhD subunit